MSEEKYLKLTDALYKAIEFFPEEEPLKNKTKGKALEIMENLVLISLPQASPNPGIIQKDKVSNHILKDIEVLKIYLKLGKSQGWIDNINFLILSEEYDKIKEEIQPAIKVMQRGAGLVEETKSPIVIDGCEGKEVSVAISDESISERQRKILKILEKQGKAQVGDLKKVFVQISKRTLRRDLDNLLKKQKVVRTGEWNEVFYRLS